MRRASLSVPRPAAARSRAMPWTPVASGRFGVRPISITGSSSPAQVAKGVPTGASSGDVDDAVMLVRQHQFALRAHHAAAFHAADVADRKRRVDAGHIGAGSREGADEARPRIGRAADDLDRIARARIDRQHAQLVGIGMLFRRQHLRDDEGLQRRLVVDGFDLEPDHGELFHDLVERGVGLEVILEPGEGEFHRVTLSGPAGSALPPAEALADNFHVGGKAAIAGEIGLVRVAPVGSVPSPSPSSRANCSSTSSKRLTITSMVSITAAGRPCPSSTMSRRPTCGIGSPPGPKSRNAPQVAVLRPSMRAREVRPPAPGCRRI
jgi:hypothetical protein